jgi:MFS transporter, SP family, arabinose:H+ symporter
MTHQSTYMTKVAAIVALGGFLMGFDASVISGVVGFIETEFELSKLQLGWAVASLTLTATIGMFFSGPLSDRYGRRNVLKLAALLFAVSALASAFAYDFISLVIARMVGGFGVGAALIVAPMFIAEMAPANKRGKYVSFNQLNIVIGITLAFFSNYLILQLSQSSSELVSVLLIDQYSWRWMLGIEFIPAILYFIALGQVPESPRWQIMQGQHQAAIDTLTQVTNQTQAKLELETIQQAIEKDSSAKRVSIDDCFSPKMKWAMMIGMSLAILQQLTGINAVFFYAPMIFEQSGVGTDASFMQAVLVGIVNLIFTIIAMQLIDRIGRKPLLITGLVGITSCMFVLGYVFRGVDHNNPATELNAIFVLIAILVFVASFAISLGPVMWVMFSEIFPNKLRALAISICGLVNSAVSFGVQLMFPWELENLGSSATFMIYGLVALIGLFVVSKWVPETKGQSLESLEKILMRQKHA